jgi:hypothetical protein
MSRIMIPRLRSRSYLEGTDKVSTPPGSSKADRQRRWRQRQAAGEFVARIGVGAQMRVSQQYWSRPVRGVRGREWKPASQPGSCG